MSNYALGILQNGFQKLIQRKGSSINIEEMETEVNYQTCRYIIENYRNQIISTPDISSINNIIDKNVNSFSAIIYDFLKAGNQLFPQYWQSDKDVIFINLICANLSWSGMWDHLITYFLKNHGEDIDGETDKQSLIFYSQKHRRYENDTFINESEIERNINITFLDNLKNIMISIEPTLSAKKGYLISNQNNTLVYKGDDPDYKFTVVIDNFEEVEKFILELTNRAVRIEYY